MKQFLKWLKDHNSDTLLDRWERKRAKDREKAERERPAKIEQKVETEAEYRENIKIEAYLLWEADGKPVGKDDYYWTLAIDKLKKKNIPTIYKPYYLLEKNVLEPIDGWIKRQASLSILTQLAILAAIIAFIGGENVRRNNEVFTAWQTITSAEGQSGSGGRIEALNFLYSRPLRFPWIGWTFDQLWDKRVKRCEWKTLLGLRWQRQDLVGLSAPKAYLRKIDLCGAKLNSVNLSQADLLFSNLSSTKLSEANLSRANLNRVNLSEADLSRANLRVADLLFADLSRANLSEADFREDLEFGKVKNLTPKQVKSACYWEEALFDSEFEAKLKKEPDQEVGCSLLWKEE